MVARSTDQAVDPKRRSTERRGVLPPAVRAVSSNPPGADSTGTPTSEDQPMTAARSPLTTADLATVTQLARQLRVDSIRASASAGSGHPISSMSAADLLAVLVARHLRYDWEQPETVDERLPTLRVPSAGAPDPGAAVGRRRHRIAGTGAARRRRRRAGRQVPRSGAVSS